MLLPSIGNPLRLMWCAHCALFKHKAISGVGLSSAVTDGQIPELNLKCVQWIEVDFDPPSAVVRYNADKKAKRRVIGAALHAVRRPRRTDR